MSGILEKNRASQGAECGDIDRLAVHHARLWAKQPIVLYGRNTISGTYGFFKEIALLDGNFKPSVRQQSGSEEVVQHVANEKYAIGYSGIGYKTAGVRAVPLALAEGAECHDTSPETTYAGKYPFARYLYVYLNKKTAGGNAINRLFALTALSLFWA